MFFRPFYFVTTYFKFNESDGRYVHILVYYSNKRPNLNLLPNPPFSAFIANNILNL